MHELTFRLLLIFNVVIPLIFFMAAVYLMLHILFARLLRDPASPILWFFDVVTRPLTRPVRSWLGPGRPEPQVRLLALGVYVMLWLVSRAFFVWLGAPRQG
jgi:hypothetical protein